jgi:hypothetical protein
MATIDTSGFAKPPTPPDLSGLLSLLSMAKGRTAAADTSDLPPEITTGKSAKADKSDPRGLVPFIRSEAARIGIDPDVAVRVARSEGLANPVGDKGKSHGAFQLYTGGGEGNLFQKATGLDPADPANEKATITWALQRARQNGWGAWYGAKRVGIRPWQGITGVEPSSGPLAYTAPAPQSAAAAAPSSQDEESARQAILDSYAPKPASGAPGVTVEAKPIKTIPVTGEDAVRNQILGSYDQGPTAAAETLDQGPEPTFGQQPLTSMQTLNDVIRRQLPPGYAEHPIAGGAIAAATSPLWALPAAAYGAYQYGWKPYGPQIGRPASEAAQAVSPFIPEWMKRLGGSLIGSVLPGGAP